MVLSRYRFCHYRTALVSGLKQILIIQLLKYEPTIHSFLLVTYGTAQSQLDIRARVNVLKRVSFVD